MHSYSLALPQLLSIETAVGTAAYASTHGVQSMEKERLWIVPSMDDIAPSPATRWSWYSALGDSLFAWRSLYAPIQFPLGYMGSQPGGVLSGTSPGSSLDGLLERPGSHSSSQAALFIGKKEHKDIAHEVEEDGVERRNPIRGIRRLLQIQP